MTFQVVGLAGRLIDVARLVLAPLAAGAANYAFGLAHVTSDRGPIHQAMEKFVANMEERPEGAVVIQIFANA